MHILTNCACSCTNYKENFLFDITKLLCLDNGYTSPTLVKNVIDSDKEILTPYKRPMTKERFFIKYDYVYEDYLNDYICPNNQVLKYSITNKDDIGNLNLMVMSVLIIHFYLNILIVKIMLKLLLNMCGTIILFRLKKPCIGLVQNKYTLKEKKQLKEVSLRVKKLWFKIYLI